MVVAKKIKRVMSEGELAIRIEKRWITRDSLVQQIDRLEGFPPGAYRQKNSFGARVKVEGCEVGGWLALDGQFLRSRHFGVKLLSDFLRDLALDCEYVIQVTIVFFGPDVRVRARVDQLGIQMDSGPIPAHASF